ncbi:MAG: hypothetical protein KAJ44_05605, partial [Thermoplasmatales archaeon]|nr:hypothetical protein [Thermoplasmatales archaeon]
MVTVVNKHLYINRFDNSYRGCEYMHSNRPLRATLISVILVLGSLLPALIIIPTVGAETVSGENTFYFKNALSFDFGDEIGIPVSQDKPTKQDDSKYPPSVVRKNTSKVIFKQELNSDEMLYWMTAWTFYLLDEIDDNLSGVFGDWEGFELFFPHPYRIVEIYEYDGNETVEIKGDIVFDLYFSSHQRQRLPKYRDEVKVGLYSIGTFLPEEIMNTTKEIKPGPIRQNGISRQQIILENTNLTLEPGESLLFSIEIIQSNKSNLVGTIIKNIIDEERILNRWKKRANILENITKLSELGTLINDVIPLFEEFNFTVDDIAEFIDTFRSSSFVYDSVDHPSSVTMEFRLPGEDENTKVYYLHNENKMNTNEPTESKSLKQQLSDSHVEWDGPALDKRNKIVKKVSVDLYLQYLNILNPGRAQVGVTLFDGSTEITSPSVKALDSSNFFAQTPTTFTFEDVNYELFYGHNLTIGVSLANGSKPGIRKVSLLYDSSEKPSSVKVIFAETDNIRFDSTTDPDNGLIVPGGSVKYTLNITSKYDDDLYIDVLEGKKGDWEVSI